MQERLSTVICLFVGEAAHTLICGSGDVNDVGDVGCELGKEGDGGGLSDPAANVPHELGVLEWWGM